MQPSRSGRLEVTTPSASNQPKSPRCLMSIYKMKNLAWLAFGIVLLSGCAGPGPVEVQPISAPAARDGAGGRATGAAAGNPSPSEGISVLPQSQLSQAATTRSQPRPGRTHGHHRPAHPFSAASSAVTVNVPLHVRRPARHGKRPASHQPAHKPDRPSTAPSQATTDGQPKTPK